MQAGRNTTKRDIITPRNQLPVLWGALAFLITFSILVDVSHAGRWFTGRSLDNQTRPITGPDPVSRKKLASSSVAINLTVSLEANPTGDVRKAWVEMMEHFADAIYESTDGAHKLGKVQIFRNSVRAESSDIFWKANINMDDNRTPHVPNGGGILNGGRINMYELAVWRDGAGNIIGQFDYLADPENAGYTMAHEMGHYFYGLYDEYDISGDGLVDQTVAPSIMNSQWQASDVLGNDKRWLNFSVAAPTNGAAPGDYQNTTQTEHHRKMQASAWEVLARDPSLDPTRAQQLNATRSGLYLGPRRGYAELAGAAPAPGANPHEFFANNDTRATLYFLDADGAATDPVAKAADPARSELEVVWMSDSFETVIVIDRSGSMGFEVGKMDKAKQAAKTLVGQFALGATRVAVIGFDDAIEVIQPMVDLDTTNDLANVQAAIDTLFDRGGTSIGEAASEALNILLTDGTVGAARVVFLLTDGQNNGYLDPRSVAGLYADNQIPLFTFGFGNDADSFLLTDMADISGGEYFFSPTTLADITDAFQKAGEVAGSRPALAAGSANIDAGTTESIPFSVDPTVVSLSLTFTYAGSTNDASVYLVDASGATNLPIDAIEIAGEAQYEFRVDGPVTGDWRIEVVATSPLANAAYNISTVVEGLTFALDVDSLTGATSFNGTNTVVTFNARLKREAYITGLDIAATLVAPDGSTNSVTFVDDGTRGDLASEDGVYTARFVPGASGQVGDYKLIVNAANTSGTAMLTEKNVLSAPGPKGEQDAGRAAYKAVTETFSRSATKNFSVTMTPSAPIFLDQPLNQTTVEGSNAFFTVAAEAFPDPEYQWQISTDGGFNWNNLSDDSVFSGATSPEITIQGATIDLDGALFRAEVFNIYGFNYSAAALLEVKLENPAYIGGVVTGVDALGATSTLSMVEVSLYRFDDDDYDWYYEEYFVTGTNGIYQFDNLYPGVYRLEFNDQNNLYATEIYDNVNTLFVEDGGSNVVVMAGETRDDIDAELSLASSLSGVVTDKLGQPIANIGVSGYRKFGNQWMLVASATTDTNGIYTLDSMMAGTYRVGFRDYWNYTYYAKFYENYAGTWVYAGATDIDVPYASAVSNIDVTMEQGSTLQGRATDTNGVPLVDVYVKVYRGYYSSEYGAEDAYYWSWEGSAYTDTNGFYEVTGLSPGFYRVSYQDFSGNFAGQVYGNHLSADVYDAGTDIQVNFNEDITNINVELPPGSSISGRVTDASGTNGLWYISVTAYRLLGREWHYAGNVYTDGNGDYGFNGLNEGEYRIVFEDYYTGDYISEVYQDTLGSDYRNDGVSILLGIGSTVTNVDATLLLRSTISGVVTNEAGQALEDIRVVAYRYDEQYDYWYYQRGTYTDTNGQYAINRLEPGEYRILYQDLWDDTYVSMIYSNFAGDDVASGGTSISLLPETVVSNINMALPVASRISGRLTDKNGQGLRYLDVTAYRQEDGDWRSVRSTSTDIGGNYVLTGLREGTYRVVFNPNQSDYYVYDPEQGDYYSEVYNNLRGNDVDLGGTDIMVPRAGTVAGIDAVLTRLSFFEGIVSDPMGKGIEDIEVTAYIYLDGYWQDARSDWTDRYGQYQIGALVAGTYRLVFNDENYPRLHADQVYPGISGNDLNLGSDIMLGEDETLTINATLNKLGAISGLVTDSAGGPIAGIYVTAYRENNYGYYSYWDSVNSVRTDIFGQYILGSLEEGEYRIVFNDNSGDYAGEVYDDIQSSWVGDGGVDVAVTYGSTTTNINAQLALNGSISGRVVDALNTNPVANTRVVLDDTQSVYTDDEGYFVMTGVRPGSYRMYVSPQYYSGYVSIWYGGSFHFPGEVPSNGVTMINVSEAENVTNINFALQQSASISGTIASAGTPLTRARFKAVNVTLDKTYYAYVNEDGLYYLTGLLPGDYYLKAEADGYMDTWYDSASQFSNATMVVVTYGDQLAFDFDLPLGQRDAMVMVTSDPPGAEIYLDMQPMGVQTPAEVRAGHILGMGSHQVAVSVKLDGHATPGVQFVDAIEGEMVSAHFDLLTLPSTNVSAITIATDPEVNAEVYLNYADEPVGVTPIVIGNTMTDYQVHMVVLRKEGYLQSAPIHVENFIAGHNHDLLVPMHAIHSGAARQSVSVTTSPTGAVVYVDYLPTEHVTDAHISTLDAGRYEGSGWSSASHTIMLRRPGYMPSTTIAVGSRRDAELNVEMFYTTNRIIGLSGSLDFGTVRVGSIAKRTLIITNAGNDILTITGITYPAGFTGPSTTVVDPFADQKLTLTFAPTSAGSYAGSIVVTSDKTEGIPRIQVSGVATEDKLPPVLADGKIIVSEKLMSRAKGNPPVQELKGSFNIKARIPMSGRGILSSDITTNTFMRIGVGGVDYGFSLAQASLFQPGRATIVDDRLNGKGTPVITIQLTWNDRQMSVTMKCVDTPLIDEYIDADFWLGENENLDYPVEGAVDIIDQSIQFTIPFRGKATTKRIFKGADGEDIPQSKVSLKGNATSE